MAEPGRFPLLPFSYIVGQDDLRRVLQIAHVLPSVGGVLISGERGTAKSTMVRAFARMMHGALPVTLPINATDDRVLGGWRIDSLMRGVAEAQEGLLEQAGRQGLLYIDEVNLLDDHVVNLILDVVSTGLLVVQREGLDRPEIPVSFTLVGTMNPEEGALRPQLLDRFGLFVPMVTEPEPAVRRRILMTVLRFDEERAREHSSWLDQGAAADAALREKIAAAKERVRTTEFTEEMAGLCAGIAVEFRLAGHRGEVVMAQAARAAAALAGRDRVTAADVESVARYAIVHRRPEATYGEGAGWTEKDQERLRGIIDGA